MLGSQLFDPVVLGTLAKGSGSPNWQLGEVPGGVASPHKPLAVRLPQLYQGSGIPQQAEGHSSLCLVPLIYGTERNGTIMQANKLLAQVKATKERVIAISLHDESRAGLKGTILDFDDYDVDFKTDWGERQMLPRSSYKFRRIEKEVGQ